MSLVFCFLNVLLAFAVNLSCLRFVCACFCLVLRVVLFVGLFAVVIVCLCLCCFVVVYVCLALFVFCFVLFVRCFCFAVFVVSVRWCLLRYICRWVLCVFGVRVSRVFVCFGCCFFVC